MGMCYECAYSHRLFKNIGTKFMTNSITGINSYPPTSDYYTSVSKNNIGLIYSAATFVTELNTKVSYKAVTNADLKAENSNSDNLSKSDLQSQIGRAHV